MNKKDYEELLIKLESYYEANYDRLKESNLWWLFENIYLNGEITLSINEKHLEMEIYRTLGNKYLGCSYELHTTLED